MDQKDNLKGAPANIAVVGVGGGGVNSILRMVDHKIPGVAYVCVNTDIKSLERVQGAKVIQIGERQTRGFGAGGDPEVGSAAAESGREALLSALDHADLVFITAGMGGGTGTGAAPIVADIAKESGAVVVAVVTTPFSFEGHMRRETALAGAARLRGKVDNLILVHNDKLLELLGKDVSIEEAFKRADEAVTQGVLAVAEVVNVPGEINVDLADVKRIVKLSGTSLMAVGQGQGATGAIDAARQAVKNPLLNISIRGAKGVLFNINGGPALTLGGVNEAGEYIAKSVDPNAVVFFGMLCTKELADKVKLTLIATGIPDQTSSEEKVKTPEQARTPSFSDLIREVKTDRTRPVFLK